MPHLPRIFISAAHKSSGKTTISVGLARALSARGTAVRMFKKGPDYIDPLWHRLASGRASYNLDFNTQEPDEIAALFANRAAGADIAIVEANKGLHDGVALDGSDSNAALAKLVRAPVVLVIDTEGITRGVAPLLLGYQAFDEDVRIAGVILNRVAGPRHEAKLRAAIEHYTDMEVLGAVRRSADLVLKERHLGLTTPGDVAARESWLSAIGEMVAEQVDLERLGEIARDAPELEVQSEAQAPPAGATLGRGLRVAVARDAAFCFLYEDDLDRFRALGAEIVFFSPLSDACLPENIDALFLPGGFPETHMTELEANAAMRRAVAAAIRSGLPTYAECGGLMYLSERIRWGEEAAEMCGIVPGEAVMNERPQGRGIVHLAASGAAPWTPAGGTGKAIRAHEFHYAALENCPCDTLSFAWEVKRGFGINGRYDGVVMHNLVAGFAHLRHTRQSPWVDAFLAFAHSVREITARREFQV